MRSIASLLVPFLVVLNSGCSMSESDKETAADKEEIRKMNESDGDAEKPSNEVPFDINMEELYGDWVLIGVGADRMGPGIAPVGEILFAFRENGNMTVATEGKQELSENLLGIPSPYTIEDKKLCSDDIVFKLQFKQGCAEIIRLNEGRMSIEIEIPNGGFIYKHFVKMEE